MKKTARGILIAVAAASFGCSLPPERPVHREELYRTRLFQEYVIGDSPESVLAALNRDGEVVVEATRKDKPVYIRIFATPEGLKIKTFDR